MTDSSSQPSIVTEQEERMARAVRKARDFDPDTLYQHLGDDYPIDCTDSHGRTFYKSWRKEIPSVRAVLATLGTPDPAQRPTEWHPIETAPKDHNSVIVWDDGVMGEAYFHDEEKTWWWSQTGPHDFDASSAIYPTLWHPMPTPPVPSAESK